MAVFFKEEKTKKNEKREKMILLTQYNNWWSIYKKLPIIVPAFVVFLFFVWAIFDITIFTSVWNPHYYEEAYHYGLFQFSSWVPVLGAWLGIGVVVAVPFWFFTRATVSAKLVEIELICLSLTAQIENEEKSATLEEKIDKIAQSTPAKKSK